MPVSSPTKYVSNNNKHIKSISNLYLTAIKKKRKKIADYKLCLTIFQPYHIVLKPL